MRRHLFSFAHAHVWGLVLACAAMLSLVPVTDLWFSTLFFNPETVAWVPRSALMQFARSGLPPLAIGALVFVVVLWIAGRGLGGTIWGVTGHHTAYLATSLILGPGLIVESLLKTFSGRARPRDVTIFYGEHPFSPALWPADACERNCSFVSGHAALAFWITAFAFILPGPYRLPVLVGGICLGTLMGLARMAEGAHFLSDVFFAGLIVVGLNIWLARWFKLQSPPTGTGHGP